MNHQHTLECLHSLRLTGMAEALRQQLTQPQAQELSFEERLAMLVDHERLYRDNRRLTRLLKAAKLRVNACVEEIDYQHPRGIDRSYLTSLSLGHWVERKQNLCITGPTGCGKTWLASTTAPALFYLLRPCSRVPWATKAAARAARCAICGYLGCLSSCGSPTATAAIRGG